MVSLGLVISCSDVTSRMVVEKETRTPEKRHTPAPIEQQSQYLPPWQIWANTDFGLPKLREAETLAAQGDLAGAIAIYRQLEQAQTRPEDREEIFLRRVGTELKRGQSQEVLRALAEYAQRENKPFEELPPRLCFVAAFAYLHQDNLEQGLAWMRLAYRRFGENERKAELVKVELARVIASIRGSELNRYKGAWLGDQFMESVFDVEYARRNQGGAMQPRFQFNWFDEKTYSMNPEVAKAAAEGLKPAIDDGPPTQAPELSVANSNIGILLPFSGQYSEHAERVRKGIELAIETYAPGTTIKVFQADTANVAEQAANEYERLVRQEHVGFVVGPMEVKGSETVGQRAKLVRVPFITFTKREGMLGDNPYMFRLGVTAASQARELANYALRVKNLDRLVVIYPANESGRELMEAFRREASANGGQVLADYKYVPGEEAQLLEQLKNLPHDGVFIADSLENVRDLVIQMRALSINSVLLGSALWNDLTAVRSLGYLIDNAIFVSPFYLPSLQPLVSTFRQRYNEKYGSDPEILSAQAYDAMALFFEALKAAGGNSDVANALRRCAPVKGVTGLLTVQENGEIERRPSIIEIRDGQTNEVMAAGETMGVQSNGTNQEEGPESAR